MTWHCHSTKCLLGRTSICRADLGWSFALAYSILISSWEEVVIYVVFLSFYGVSANTLITGYYPFDIFYLLHEYRSVPVSLWHFHWYLALWLHLLALQGVCTSPAWIPSALLKVCFLEVQFSLQKGTLCCIRSTHSARAHSICDAPSCEQTLALEHTPRAMIKVAYFKPIA